MIHPAALPPERLLEECDVKFLRRSGPGGQNRNKVETAALLTHRPTGVQAEANELRSQAENRQVALFRLRVRLALAFRRPPSEVRDEPGPSPLWSHRLQGGRIVVSPTHDDFPTMLAEVLDVLNAYGYDLSVAASRLECSQSQLIRFLKKEPRAFALLNHERRQRGLHVLH